MFRLRNLIAFAAGVFGAVPAHAAECSALKLLTSIDLRVVAAGRPGVEIQVAGTAHVFMIDTGGAVGTLSRRVAQKLGLKSRKAYRYELTNVNGEPMSQTVRVPSLDVGAVHRGDTLFYVDDTTPPEGASGQFDGSLAPDFLREYDADFDFARGKFNLFSQDHCEGKVVYWKPPAVAAIPFQTDKAGHVLFEVELDGRKIGAMLDTGTANTNLNLVTAQRAFRVDLGASDVEKIGELKGNYTADIYRRNFKTLTLAGITFSNPALVLMPDMITPANPTMMVRTPDMAFPPRILTPRLHLASPARREPDLPPVVLGMSVLRMLHVYIAYGERKLYISAAIAAPPPTNAVVTAP